MPFALRIFVILAILSFIDSAPSKTEKTARNSETSKKESKTDTDGDIPGPADSRVHPDASGDAVGQDDNIEDTGTKHHHGLNLKELLILKAIMDEDLKDMSGLAKEPIEESMFGGRSLRMRDEFGTTDNSKENQKPASQCSFMVCPTEYSPVCGSNKITYDNYCKLLQQTCADSKLTKLYDRECESEAEDANDDDEFDPVFGKLRDFLDELSVADIKRAIGKLEKKHTLETDNARKSVEASVEDPRVEDPEEKQPDDSRPCALKLEAIAKDNLLGINRPLCDDDGFYMLKQCGGSVCYCVDKYGTSTLGQAPLWKANELICDKQEGIDDAIESLKHMLDRFDDTRG